jgi:hypothetical protein
VLRESGVVAVDFAEDDARGRRYSLREEPFVALQAWLDQVHAFWGEQLAGFADHVRRTAATGTGTASGTATRTDAARAATAEASGRSPRRDTAAPLADERSQPRQSSPARGKRATAANPTPNAPRAASTRDASRTRTARRSSAAAEKPARRRTP